MRPNESAVVDLRIGRHVLVGRMDWAASLPLQVETKEAVPTSVEVSLPFSSVIDSLIRPKQAIKSRLLS